MRKALILPAVAVVGGLIGLVDRTSFLSVAVLMVGLAIGIGCIIAVQHKYNNGIF